MKRFVTSYLDPASRLGEILFGLIMVLTVTLAAGLSVPNDSAGARQLLATAIGCNIAWGLIDAVMYLMNCVTVRSGKIRLIEAVRRASNPEAALELVHDEVDPELQELLDPADAQLFNQSVLKHISRARIRKRTLTKGDVYGAIACFWLVFLSCLPATIPFLVFSRPLVALRVSNLLLIGLLFFVGHKWARYAGTNPLLTGTAMVVIGLILVGIAIPLGG